MLDVCRSAVERGIKCICFTEHLDFEPTDCCFGAFDYEGYKDKILEAQRTFADVLDVRCGVEVDFQTKFRARIDDFLAGVQFDYVLGSAHYVNGQILEDHEHYFPGKTADEAYVPYFDNVLATVRTGIFDTIAHMDLCKRYGVRYYGEFDWSQYAERIEQILREVIGRKMALEINTSGLRQSPGATYPGRGILELYYSLGGRRITVGSDSHRVADAGAGIGEALALAREVGFESVTTFAGRRPEQVPII